MENKIGFSHEGKTVKFIDAKGRDISFYRWRVDLYYDAHLAITYFFDSEYRYTHFIKRREQFCFDNYDDFRATTEHGMYWAKNGK